MSRKILTQPQYEFEILTLFFFLQVKQNESHRHACWRRGLVSCNGCSEWKVCYDELNLMGQFSLFNHINKAKCWNAFSPRIFFSFCIFLFFSSLTRRFFLFSIRWNCSNLTNCNKVERIVLPKRENDGTVGI